MRIPHVQTTDDFSDKNYLEDVIINNIKTMDVKNLQIDIVLSTFNNTEFSKKIVESIFDFLGVDYEDLQNQLSKYDVNDLSEAGEKLAKIAKLLKEQQNEINVKITEFFIFNLPYVYLKNMLSKDKFKFIDDLNNDNINIREKIIEQLNNDITTLKNSVNSFNVIGDNLVAKQQKDDYAMVQEKLERRTYKLITQYYLIISIIDEIPQDNIKKLVLAYIDSIGERL